MLHRACPRTLSSGSRCASHHDTPDHRSGPGVRARSAVVVAAALGLMAGCLAGCGGDDKAETARYSATIRWTSHGIPHIRAQSLDDAIFGQGYAFAALNVCTLADQIVKVKGERARWFGPGEEDVNVQGDFTHKALGVRAFAEKAWKKGLSAQAKGAIEAYAAGYNAYLDKVGPSGLPERCRDQPWVTRIEGVDLMTYYAWLSIFASSGYSLLADFIGQTDPPVSVAQAPRGRAAGGARVAWLGAWSDGVARLARVRPMGAQSHDARRALGSNGWALGKDKSTYGKGMLVANPHFPWFGELRLYESHLQVPGELDVSGVALMGVPGVLIGFNEQLAWTATVSASIKFTAYQLALKPGDPFTYLVEGEERKITGHDETVQILQPDGSLTSETRTFYSSEVGPMIEVAALGPLGLWDDVQAFTLRDANGSNANLVDHFLHMARAKSVQDAATVFTEQQGNPWTNSMIADSAGKVLYSESNSVPNLSAEALAAHAAAVKKGGITAIIANFGFYMLDGTIKASDWLVEAGSREPGLVPWSKTPHLVREDYVANANESHWLSNPHAPLEGYSPAFGRERTPRGLRTRMNLTMLEEKTDKGASGPDGLFDLDELEAVIYNNRVLGAELLLDGVLDMCKEVTSTTLKVGDVDTVIALAPACAVLAGWDRTNNLESKGAVLWRETISDLDGLASSKTLYEVPWSVKDPVFSPRVLKKSAWPKIAKAMGLAVIRLQKVGFALDATLGALQYSEKGGQRFKIHGGLGEFGAFNVMAYSPDRNTTRWPEFKPKSPVNAGTGLTADGYPINYGASFVMALAFTDAGPKARALLTYSQSAEPDSPWFADQTRLLEKRSLRPVLFRDADIDADAALKVEKVSGVRHAP